MNPAYEVPKTQDIAEALSITVKASMNHFLEQASEQSRGLSEFAKNCKYYENTKFIQPEFEKYYY